MKPKTETFIEILERSYDMWYKEERDARVYTHTHTHIHTHTRTHARTHAHTYIYIYIYIYIYTYILNIILISFRHKFYNLIIKTIITHIIIILTLQFYYRNLYYFCSITIISFITSKVTQLKRCNFLNYELCKDYFINHKKKLT